MKFSLSFMMDPDLHSVATDYAAKKNISFSRLIQEALFAVVSDQFDPEIRAKVEARIATHPGRRPLTPEERLRRDEEREKKKAEKKAARAQATLERLRERYPDARPANPADYDNSEELRDGKWVKREE
jgi:hypothetical protein